MADTPATVHLIHTAVPTLIKKKTVTIAMMKVKRNPMMKRDIVKSFYPKKVKNRPMATPAAANMILFFATN